MYAFRTSGGNAVPISKPLANGWGDVSIDLPITFTPDYSAVLYVGTGEGTKNLYRSKIVAPPLNTSTDLWSFY